MVLTRNQCQAASSRKASAVRHSAALLFLAILCNGSDVFAQDPRDTFNRFASIPQLAVTKSVQAKWKGSIDAKDNCLDQNLRPRGSNTSALIEQNIPFSDGRVVLERASCQNQITQSIVLTKLTSAQTDPYGVDGLTLGSKVAFGTQTYRQYQCGPSQKFAGFVWCTKTISDKEVRGRVKASILHAQDGTVVYVNRYQEPAFWSGDEVADDIERYSSKIGEEPHIIQMPARPGLPKGILAAWGKVVLEPIVGDELKLLGEDKPLQTGIAIDFIGNFTQSARQGLPIYRLAGGAGFVWAASYNQSGRGTLRFSAVDASAYSPQSLPSSATTRPPLTAGPDKAATAIDARISPSPGVTAPPPVEFGQALADAGHDAPKPTPPPATSPPLPREEHLGCSAASECGGSTPAASPVLTPTRDPHELIAPNHSIKPLQQTAPPDGTAQYKAESATSNFGSTESKHVMLDLFVTYWPWIISALIASVAAGYRLSPPRESRGRGILGWQGWGALVFIIGLFVAILQLSPGQIDLHPDALPSLSFVCITGFLAGAWLRRVRTDTRVVSARAAEEVHREAETKAAEKARYAAEAMVADIAAEAKAAARRAAEEKASEDGLRAAEVKAVEDLRLAAEAKAAEGVRGVAQVQAADDLRLAAEVKDAEVAGLAVEAKDAEAARGAAETNAAKAGSVARAKVAKKGRRAVDDARLARKTQAAEGVPGAAKVEVVKDVAVEDPRLAIEAKATKGAKAAKDASRATEAGDARRAARSKTARETRREGEAKPRSRPSAVSMS